MEKVFTLFVLALVVSCAPKVRTDVATTRPPLADDAEVIVPEESTPAPAAAVDSTWNYAKLYVFRRSGYGLLISYNLHLGDSVIARVSNNFAEEIIVTEEGPDTLWARTESRTEVPIEIEFGKAYYLRCSVKMGIMAGRPKLSLVDAATGKTEYTAIMERKQKKDKK